MITLTPDDLEPHGDAPCKKLRAEVDRLSQQLTQDKAILQGALEETRAFVQEAWVFGQLERAHELIVVIDRALERTIPGYTAHGAR